MLARPHMQKVKSKNTQPEINLRKLLCGMGYRRYRLHYKNLPGKPDIVFVSSRKVIFLHGCFWHGHNCKSGRNTPKTNTDYWDPKLQKNKIRDLSHKRKIKGAGWSVLTVWECQLKESEKVKQRLKDYMEKRMP